MSPLVVAAALAAGPAAAQSGRAETAPYGVLLLAYDAGREWRKELGSLRAAAGGRPVESVWDAESPAAVQRAVDRLAAQRVSKIVGVPLETVGASARVALSRWMFGAAGEPARDAPGRAAGVAAPSVSRLKRLQSPVPLILAPAMDASPLLVDILADRARALARDPSKESLVLAGIAPLADEPRAAWKAAADGLAAKVAAKAGFRRGAAAALRDGARHEQRERDRAELRETLRELGREGRVAVVPLSPEPERVDALLKRDLGFTAYRWDGRGIRGDRRLGEWIKTAAEQAAGGRP